MKRVYLDYAATTPTDDEVVAEMQPYFGNKFGNPSSIHAYGQETKIAIEKARDKIASFISAQPEELIFTSGGTESNNFAIKGIADAYQQRGNHIIVSAIEHHAVIGPCDYLKKRGFEITYIPVDKYGLVNPEDTRKALTDKTILISVMHANNEIGTIQPVSEIGRIAKEKGICFHVDAVQTIGHLPVNVDELNIDLLSMSAHKLYGPKGIGALYIRKGTRITPFLHGGEQERGKRATTENIPGIIGFAKAVEIAKKDIVLEAEKLRSLQQKFIKGLKERIPSIHLNGHEIQRLPNNVNISVEYIEGESILLNLDMEGIAASTGSACSSGSLEPSHVLLALGLSPEIAHGSVRFTMGKQTTEEEVDYVLDVLPKIVEKLRLMSPLYKQI